MSSTEYPELQWDQPTVDIRQILDAFRAHIASIHGVKRAWARVEDGRLRFTILIVPKDSVERAVYEAELLVMDEIGPEYVAFDVFRNSESLKYYLQQSEHALVAS